ncbi:MAG TPA: universal stress protein [Gemmatimonadales bacterium]|nr:universal stress protein [Gemmatimonadales bacterium]
MYHKIIWATDGSAAADAAFPQVQELASANGTSVVVLHCEEAIVGPRSYGVTINPDEPDIKEKIREQAEDLESAGVPVTTEFIGGHYGVAAHAIAEAAARDGADLIVVGTRGHSALGGLMLGSVTQRLLHIAPCPVLAVPLRD